MALKRITGSGVHACGVEGARADVGGQTSRIDRRACVALSISALRVFLLTDARFVLLVPMCTQDVLKLATAGQLEKKGKELKKESVAMKEEAFRDGFKNSAKLEAAEVKQEKVRLFCFMWFCPSFCLSICLPVQSMIS